MHLWKSKNKNPLIKQIQMSVTLKARYIGILLLLVSCGNPNAGWESDPTNNKIVHVCGQVENFPIKYVKIFEAGVLDARYDDGYRIPAKKGSFAADVPLNPGKVYELYAFDVNYTSVSACFFADQDTVRMMIEDPKPEWIPGAEGNNQEYQLYKSTLRDYFRQKEQALKEEYDTIDAKFTEAYERRVSIYIDKSNDPVARDTAKIINDQMLADSTAFTPAYKAYLSRNNRLKKDKLDFTRAYLEAREPSLALFEVLFESLRAASDLEYHYSDWIRFYRRDYADKFPDCNLHQAVDDISSARLVHEGMPFIDFTLPDKDGNLKTLSELIEGKYALVQFWATWCNPCITKRRTIRPFYDQYKDKGFTVVEIAREFKSDSKWRAFIQKDGAEWTDLLAMEESHAIGVEYGLSQKAGDLFLIDPEGIIMKISPTKEEISEVLEGMNKGITLKQN